MDCLLTDPVNWNGFNQRLDCVTFALRLHTSQASRYEILHLQKSTRYTPHINAPFNIVKYFAENYTIWWKKLHTSWKFANYVALLDDNRWVKRILHWNPGGGRPGRPFFQWQTPVQNFCRWHHLGTWLDIARNTDLWFQYYADFISFVQA